MCWCSGKSKLTHNAIVHAFFLSLFVAGRRHYHQYYALNGAEHVSKRKVVFEDEVQLLQAFIVIWSVGFAWCLCLKWPHSIQSLFLRRCVLSEATHVGIFLKRTAERDVPAAYRKPGSCCTAFLSSIVDHTWQCIRFFMSLLFSDRDCYHCRPDGTYQICPVHREADSSRFIVLLLRRYNYGHNDESNSMMFVSNKYKVGGTIRDLQIAGGSETGLAVEEVDQRLRLVGPNSIEMPKPVVWKVVYDEFCKPFYTYQLFMVFSCTCIPRIACKRKPHTLSWALVLLQGSHSTITTWPWCGHG
jgi:hypothetical protein